MKDCAAKWYPRLFNTEMIRALLAGKKTATRWPLPKQPVDGVRRKGEREWEDVAGSVFRTPVWPGCVIWARETWFHVDESTPPVFLADGQDLLGNEWTAEELETIRWKPNIHMPRRFARIFLRVTQASLMRVQDISEEEAQAEGVSSSVKQIVKFGRGMRITTARQNFAQLWDTLYSKRGLGWDVNPYVWAATFRRLSKEEALNG